MTTAVGCSVRSRIVTSTSGRGSDPTTGTLTIDGSDAPKGQQLVVWLPPATGTDPDTTGSTGLTATTIVPVEGGALLHATVEAADYRLQITP